MTVEPPVTFEPESRPCPTCGEPVEVAANFCEGCGAQLGEVTAEVAQAAPRVENPASVPISRPTHVVTDSAAPDLRRPCQECGGPVDDDLYCQHCGSKAPSDREHFREAPASWVGGVCDRGAKRQRNEDAMALYASQEPGHRCVLVVLDGVSTSTDSDVASLAGARAARDLLRAPIPQGLGTAESREAAARKALTDAAAGAQVAMVAHTEPVSENPASATFTCIVLETEPHGPVAWVGNLGDSRAYWIPDVGPVVQLTRDDSGAQALIDAGMGEAEAHASSQAHAITRWLGRDSENVEPTITPVSLTEDGWLLACSDGYWNYAHTLELVGSTVQTAAAEHQHPEDVALALVQWSIEQGGHDNVTVAMARLGPLPSPEASLDHDSTKE